MKARLFCTIGLFSGSSFEFSHEATIGKKKDNVIVLDQPVISGRHARIFFDETAESYFLEDLGSRNGTKLDGVKITQKEKLGNLHIVTFAQKFDFIFQVLGSEENASRSNRMTRRGASASLPEKPQRSSLIETPGDEAIGVVPRPQPANGKTIIEGALLSAPSQNVVAPKTVVEALTSGKRALTPPPHFNLEVQGAGPEGKIFQLSDGKNLIGRSPQCEIVIDDPSVSRQHAVIAVQAGRILLKDLASRNHTFVEEQIVAAEVEVRPDTSLHFGKVAAKVVRKA
jgi:pSer/pThr/pTyr-binding forkhead associated (FHA) protein